MNTDDKNEVQKQTEASKQEAMDQGRKNDGLELKKDQPIHTINPLTGAESNIIQEYIEGIEKLHEANTERD